MILILIYNQVKLQQVILAMSYALAKVGQDTEDYRSETRALLYTILQLADQVELQEPEERKPVVFTQQNQA